MKSFQAVSLLHGCWRGMTNWVCGAAKCLWQRLDRRPASAKTHSCDGCPDRICHLGGRFCTVALYCSVLTGLIAWRGPAWISVPMSYLVASPLPLLLPAAHGAHCCLGTVVSCGFVTVCIASPACGAWAAAVLCCLPRRWMWWPDAEDSDLQVCDDVENWLQEHDYVMPTEHKNPTDDQRMEYLLRKKYRHLWDRQHTWSRAVQTKVDRIERLKSNPADVQTCRQLLQWLQDHGNALPKQYQQRLKLCVWFRSSRGCY